MRFALPLLRLVAFLGFAFVGAAAAAALPPGVTQGPTVEGITEYTLKNGMRVLLFPDASQPKVVVNVTYLVGSRHENYGETGMAHLLEHMMFKGTPQHPKLDAEFSKRGIQSNASTSYDRTNYHETFNASEAELEWALAMEADRMTRARIRREDLDTEMPVVRNEMEQGENNPSQILMQRLLATMYEWHNYGKETIGARSDVEGVDIGRLQAFYRLYYQPDNAVLTVAGAFDEQKTLALVAKLFGAIPRPARALPRLYTVEPVQDGDRLVTLRRVGNVQIVAAAYHTLPAAHPDYVALDALADIMTVAPAGRLYKALVDTKQATMVENWNAAMYDPGFVAFFAQLSEADSLAAARTTMLEVLEGVKAQPITDAELDRVRAKALKRIDQVLADPTRLGLELTESIAAGDWRLFFVQRDRWRKVTAADVEHVALAWLKPANRTVAQFVPDAAPDRSPAPPAVDRAAMFKDYKGDPAVAAGETLDPTPATLDARTERFTLASGMKVTLLPKKTRGETVRLTLVLHQGDEKSLFGTAPRGGLAAAMLMRGTQKRSRQEIEDTLDRLRARLSVDGGETSWMVAGEAVRANLPETLKLVAEVLREPVFPRAEFEKLQREQIAALEATRAEPEALVTRAQERYGNPYPAGDVRYTPTLDEEVRQVGAVTLADLSGFHARFVGASHAELAIVGDFDAVATRAAVTELFGAWASPAPYTRVPDLLVARAPTAMMLETPDKANAKVEGQLALPLTDASPDYPALITAMYLLGQVENSRLYKRIRDKEGLSYGVYAYVEPDSHEPNSTFRVGAIFAPENFARLKAAFAEELARAARDGFTEAEVAEAKAGLVRLRRLARTRDASLAGSLVQQAELGRTFAFSGKVDAAIEALTVADVNAALRKYVDPARIVWAYAGDFAKAKK